MTVGDFTGKRGQVHRSSMVGEGWWQHYRTPIPLSDLATPTAPDAAPRQPLSPGRREICQDPLFEGGQLAVLKAGTEGEIDAAFASLVQLQAGALVDPDGFLSGRREQLVAPASRQAVPAIYADRQFVAAGGLFIRHIAAALMPTGP
jgi:hypothetical protein